MAKLNRTCFVCGKKHSYCPSCYDDRHLETWHIMFDNENCKNIFNIINQCFYKNITTEEAKSQLEKCDLSTKDGFVDDIKNEIDKLISYKVEAKKPTEEPVVDMNNKTSYKNKK